MFKKNDKALYFCRNLIKIIIVCLCTLGVLGGAILIWLSTKPEIIAAGISGLYMSYGVILIIVLPIVSIIMWFVENLIFTFMIDVKLIRNKLYDVTDVKLISISTGSKQK